MPNYRNIVTLTKPENIVIAVDTDEQMSTTTMITGRSSRPASATSSDALRRAQAVGKPLPEVHIRGDKDVRFEAVGRVILACQQAGIQKVGFITEPPQ